MKYKRKILFVIESLTLAGSEKSLIALLSNLDPELYEIDLQLFNNRGELYKFIPDYVNTLPILDYVNFSSKPWKDNVKQTFREKGLSYMLTKLRYSFALRIQKRTITETAKLYWQTVEYQIEKDRNHYDVAIAFAQGVPTFYVMDKITAKKKITWVNANVQFTKNNFEFQQGYYNRFDEIVAISTGTKEHLVNIFPKLINRINVIPNIIDYKSISKLSSLDRAPMRFEGYKILTIGRLDKGMKGMDITIKACKILRDKGFGFHWYILGKGPFKQSMEEYIHKHNLDNYISLMGTTDNPYPYFKAADLYVQTSRHEGYGRTIAEARMLNLPIVTTNFDTVRIQIQHLKNGIITEINPEAVAEGIIKLMNDKNLYNFIQENLENEPKENTETVKRFDAMINNLLSNN